MTERENLPAVIAAQAVTVLSEQRSSLVGRGLAAIHDMKKEQFSLTVQCDVEKAEANSGIEKITAQDRTLSQGKGLRNRFEKLNKLTPESQEKVIKLAARKLALAQLKRELQQLDEEGQQRNPQPK